MGCGCNRNRGNLPTRPVQTVQTVNRVASVRSAGISQPPSQAKIVQAPTKDTQNESNKNINDSQNLNIKPNFQSTVMGMSKERLEIEKKKREAIRKALGK